MFADLINKKIDEFGPITNESADSTNQTESSETPKDSSCDFCELGKEVTSDIGAIYTMRYSKETEKVIVKYDDNIGVFKLPKCPFCGKPLGQKA